MENTKGWSPLSIGLKVIIVLGMIGVFFSITSLKSIAKTGYPLLGYDLFGSFAIMAFLIFNIGGWLLLAYAILNRLKWTSNYGMAFFGFFLLNSLLSLINLKERLAIVSEKMGQNIPELAQTIYVSAIIEQFSDEL